MKCYYCKKPMTKDKYNQPEYRIIGYYQGKILNICSRCYTELPNGDIELKLPRHKLNTHGRITGIG